MHSWNSKQANDILLKEQNAVISDKQQIADIFKDHFVNIANGAPEINEHPDFGVDLNEHPSIIAIQDYLTIKNKVHLTTSLFNTSTRCKLSSLFQTSMCESPVVMTQYRRGLLKSRPQQ